jgi:hypothetical protein
MVNNFLMCGKLGDFLHAMFAVKNICEQNNIKANIYMYDIGWEFGIQKSHSELQPIFLQQSYVDTFNILKDYEIDPIQIPQQNTPIRIYNKKLLEEGYIDLGSYIRSPWLYKTCWSDLYSKTFNFKIGKDYKWITYDKINSDLENKILIQRKAHTLRNPNFHYNNIIANYGKENIIFISSTQKDYEEFPNKSEIPFYKVTTLDQWFTALNSSAMIVANLSAPAVMAHAMDKLRIIELPYTVDAQHCIGEERYSNNVYWYLSDQENNLK